MASTERPPHGFEAQERARSVLIEVASRGHVRDDYPIVASLVDNAGLGKIVDLAWRHQFDDDRYAFKRDIRELQEYVLRMWRASEDRDEPAL